MNKDCANFAPSKYRGPSTKHQWAGDTSKTNRKNVFVKETGVKFAWYLKRP
jgi:hypothetical protein